MTQQTIDPNQPWQMGHKPMMEFWKERNYAIQDTVDNRNFTSRSDYLDN